MPNGRSRNEGSGPVAGEDVWEAEGPLLRWCVLAGEHIDAVPSRHPSAGSIPDPKVICSGSVNEDAVAGSRVSHDERRHRGSPPRPPPGVILISLVPHRSRLVRFANLDGNHHLASLARSGLIGNVLVDFAQALLPFSLAFAAGAAGLGGMTMLAVAALLGV